MAYSVSRKVSSRQALPQLRAACTLRAGRKPYLGLAPCAKFFCFAANSPTSRFAPRLACLRVGPGKEVKNTRGDGEYFWMKEVDRMVLITQRFHYGRGPDCLAALTILIVPSDMAVFGGR